jgi:hypothetical protein
MNAPPIADGFDISPAIFELAQIARWVCWKYEQRDGKHTKVPYTTGLRRASSTDPRTWGKAEACRLVAFEEGSADGIGFMLDGSDDLVAVDLDGCVTDGTLAPWAQKIAERLNSYTEISPSGTGVRIFVRGKLSVDGRRKGDIEMYANKRYVTVTGNHLAGFPKKIRRCPKALERLYVELFGEDRTSPNGHDRDGAWPELPDPMPLADVERCRRIFFPDGGVFPSASERDYRIACVAVHSCETPRLRTHAAAGSGATYAALMAAGVW